VFPWVVPTHDSGTDDSPYLTALFDGLDADIEVMWTGMDVVNDRIDAADALRRRGARPSCVVADHAECGFRALHRERAAANVV
jgi:hypothetical protein